MTDKIDEQPITVAGFTAAMNAVLAMLGKQIAELRAEIDRLKEGGDDRS